MEDNGVIDIVGIGLYVTDADAGAEVTIVGESVIVTDTDSNFCVNTVGAIVQVFVAGKQSDAEDVTLDGSVHE